MKANTNDYDFNINYWRNYHYIRDPFSSTDKSECFISSSWYEYLDILPQFVRYCNTLLLITGEPRIGKSTLIKLFIDNISLDKNICFIKAVDCQGVGYLLQLLHQKFSAPYDDNATIPISEQLTEQLDYLKENKVSRVLIIDDAQQLPLDVRQACLQIIQQQTAVDTCLPIILIGEQPLSAQFNALLTPTTAQDCLHTINMEPFDYEQTKNYLIWACKQVGGENIKLPFSNEDIETIYKASDGIIGSINDSARRLLANKQAETFDWKHSIIKKLLWWGGILLTIAILLMIYQYINQPSKLNKTFTKPISTRNIKPSKIEPTLSDVAINKSNILVKSESKTIQKSKKVLKPKVKSIQTEKDNTLFTKIMAQELLLQRKRVLSINPKNYTLQLLGTHNLHTARKFVTDHQLQATAMIVRVESKHKMWYIVLYGIFPSRKKAQTAVKTLYPQLKLLHPWVRSYKNVHKAINKSTHEK